MVWRTQREDDDSNGTVELVLSKGAMTPTLKEAAMMIEVFTLSSAVVNVIDIDKNLPEEANSPAF